MLDDGQGAGRGFTLTHQRVVIEIDFAGALIATAHLSVNPTSPALRTLYLHASPLLDITKVTLASPTPNDALSPTSTSFTLSNPFQPLPVREPPVDARSHTEIKRKTWASVGEEDEGELAISVSGGWVRLLEVEGEGVGGEAAVSLAPIQVQIDYRLVLGGDVAEGVVFRRPGDDGEEDTIPHMFISPTAHDAARIWTPCIDSLWERCTWELDFIVPKFLEGGEESPVLVISSGELTEQTTHPHAPCKTIFSYLQTNPTSVQHISFAAGPFEVFSISESPKPLIGFSLPGDIDMLIHSTSFLHGAMSFYSTEFGSYPFADFKVVFVSNPRTQSFTSATLAIVSSDLLSPPSVIDQPIVTRQVLSLSLIQQWIGINIIQRTLADTWLVNGLSLYMQGLFLRHLLGNNEYRFRLKKDIDRCVRQDQGDHWPLCVPGIVDPPDIGFMNLKAPLVLHILDRFLIKAGTSLGLSRVIPRIFLSALSEELSGNMLSTQSFFRTCRKVSGIDLQLFQDQWVYGSGCPRFRLQTNFIRKKFVVEFSVEQSQPAYKASDEVDETQRKFDAIWKRPTPFFEGSLSVRIHEADGAPFEHLVDIKTQYKLFPLPFNTKYKRTRRSGHIAARFNKLQDDLDASADIEADEVQLRNADRAEIFAHPPWDEEEERMRWRVAEWSEEQASQMIGEGGGYEWIRIDPECEWLASFEFAEKPWYWISQLQGDRDVIAQLEAVHNMSLYPFAVVASELARTVLVKNYFYRVRMEAARALVSYSTTECGYIGVFLLLKLFQTFYCLPSVEEDEDALRGEFRLKPNDFSDLSDYFIKKSIVLALADLRDPTSRSSWHNIRRLMLNILGSNDNTLNKYSDSSYLATVITAIGNASLAVRDRDEVDQNDLRDAVSAVDRALTMDRLAPSYHNLITTACLRSQMKSILAGHRTSDPRLFLGYTREGNFEPVRLLAFDCLFLCKPLGRSSALATYLLEIIQKDHSLRVRRHVTHGISESILMSLAVGEVSNIAPATGIVDVNLETDQSRDQRSEVQDSSIVKALRKEFGKKPDLRRIIQEALLDRFTRLDHELRFALIKIAEIIVSSISEPLPGHLITLQTPNEETLEAVAPKIRISMSASTGNDGKVETDVYGLPTADRANAASIKFVMSSSSRKSKTVHKSQTKGLPDADRAAISNALKKLMAFKSSYYFRLPVDPIRDDAPNYLTIVQHPMDLSTAQAKLDNGHYASREDFVADVRAIVSNCNTYNPVGSLVRKSGAAFESYFDNLWAKTEATLMKSTTKASTGDLADSISPNIAGKATSLLPEVKTSTAPTKLKVKPPRTVTIDTTPTRLVPPMAPPPIPPNRKSSGARSTPPAVGTQEVDKSSKKRKEPIKIGRALDDMLGDEIDAMERSFRTEPDDARAAQAKTKKTRYSDGNGQSPEMAGQGRLPILFAPREPEAVISESLTKKVKDKASSAFVPAWPTPATPIGPPKHPQLRLVSRVQPQPPADLPPTADNPIPFRTKRARALMAILMRDQNAYLFLNPVNPEADGVPTYLDEIKEPMDLGTISKNIDTRRYKTMGQLAYDIELVFENCRKFNNPGDAVTALADALETVYWQEWPKAVCPQMTAGEKKDMTGMLGRATKDARSLFFRTAVDPVALNVPRYFDIIPREDARDLSLIKRKLDKGLYATARQVDEDIELMLENARVFNGEGAVVDAANAFGAWWQTQRTKME